STPQAADNAPISWNCTAGHFCLFHNHKEACPAGFFCPENTAQPLYCCGGYYCPTPDKIKICPEGKFCPHGSTEPQGCHFLAKCPEGTATVSKFGVIFLFGAFMTVASMLFAIKQRKDNIKRNKYQHLLQYGYGAQDESANVDMGQVERTFDISFRNLGLVLPSGVEIMRGVSGELKSSRCCAILGPSGAGKTTFVSLLTGKVQRTSGSVQVNGVDEPLSNYSKLIGFVPQEDIMLRELTVRDILMHSAMMRLPAKLPQRAKKKKVLETIKYLELGHVMDSVIGDEATRGISGGQRKRVNIGMELVANPSVLFLDEPTSGLDSATSYEVCSLLRNIAHKQRLTVAAVIHSPSPQAFDQFDDLLVLGKGGRVVYFGPRDQALDYFDSIGFTCPPDENPADFYIAVTSGKVRPRMNPNYRPSDLFLFWERHTLSEDVCLSSYPARMGRLGMLESSSSPLPLPPPSLPPSYCYMADDPAALHYPYDQDVGVATRALARDWTSYLWDLGHEFYCFMASVLQFWRSDPIRSTPNVLVVFLLCFKRACMQIYRSRGQFLKDQLLHLGCGAFISIAARQSDFLGRQPESICQVAPIALQFICREPFDHIAEVGIFVSLGVLFSGINVGLSTFGNEKVVYWRDSATGMRTIPYFLAKMVADLPRCLIAALCFSLSFIVFFPY
ncbi:P-loop containing nucleoside triphosphate hydrolase protein, partial [Syncephalis pseudoplumigaleata]